MDGGVRINRCRPATTLRKLSRSSYVGCGAATDKYKDYTHHARNALFFVVMRINLIKRFRSRPEQYITAVTNDEHTQVRQWLLVTTEESSW